MNKSGRCYSGFLRTLVLTGVILFVLAVGATSSGAISATARSMPQAQATTPHEPPEPDVERARSLNDSTEYSLPSQSAENRPKTSSQARTDQPLSEEIDDPTIVTHNVTVLEPAAEEKFITESWYNYAPGLDDFRSDDWLNGYNPELADCHVDFESENKTLGKAIDLIADGTGVNPRVLLVVYILQSSVSSTATSCQEAQAHLDGIAKIANEMGQLRLFYQYGNEGIDTSFVSPSSLQRQGFFHNDVSFAVAHATTVISAKTDKEPQEVTTEFYQLFKQYFGDPEGTPPYLLSDEVINSVTYLMPFYSGQRPFTGGPHGGGVTNSCVGVSLSDVSGLDFGSPDNATALQNAVVAIAAGEVVGLKTTTSNPGRWVAVRHDNGVVSMYWHLASINSSLRLNQRINVGAYLGDIGNTGCPNCGVHIHVELRQGGANYNLWSGIGAPVPWTERVINGWRIYPEVFASGLAANYNGTALKNSAVNGNFQKEISACGGKVMAAVEQNFPYSAETNTEITKFAQINRSTVLTSTNNVHCPASNVISEGTLEFTDDLCGSDPPDDTIAPSASGFSASVINGRTAEISTSGVQDNNGGSGVKEVRFSAKWGGNWYGIGTDSSAPYTLTWDMCSSGVPNGDVELGMVVHDNAGNYWNWSEHYGNPHITKNSACGGSGDPQPGGEWHANFWMNKYLAGYVNWDVYYLWDDGKWPYIWFDWGINGPKEGWSGDEFSLRIWRNVYFPGGRYEFRTDGDDGVRVYVDGKIVVDHWWAGSASGAMDISPGTHEVKVEYFEDTGNAKLEVAWYGPGYPEPDRKDPDGKITVPDHLSAVNTSPFTIWAEAWDDVSGVAYVRFMAHYCQGGQCGWHELGTVHNAPYNYNWDWNAISEQHVWLAIHVADKTGKVTYDPGGWVEVDLDKTSPSAEIVAPVDGAYLTGNNVQISALAGDSGSGVESVQFFAGYTDGSGEYWHELGFDTNGSDGWNKSWDASSVNDQRDASFFVYAYDRADNYVGAATWATVLDRVPPTSAVQGLPSTSPASFSVQWSGSDAISGVAGFDIDYQQDGGSWTRWKTGVTETSATFDGANGHTYGFRSRAIDMAGHVEAWPPSPDALTTVSVVQPPQSSTDIFWYAPGAARDYLHLSNGDGTFRSINQNIGGTYTPLISDFNGDEVDDIFWYAPGAAPDYLHLSNGDGTFRSVKWNIGGTYTPLVGDFNSDGADDIFWYAPGAARDYLHLSNWNGTFRSVGWNIGGTYTPLISDFNGDGADDIFWYAPGAAPDYLHLSNWDGTFRSVKWNVGGTYAPLLGDFNGDGADDIFWYAPGATRDYLHLSNWDGTFRSVGWNIGGTYAPLLGDFNGDGADDIFWYAPGAARDYLHLSNWDGTFRSVGWNIGGAYTPLVGIYD